MPIRYVDKVSRLGSLQTTLDHAQPAFTGTHVGPPTRTGVLVAQASPDVSAIVGQHFPIVNRNGVIQTTLAGATALFQGTHTGAGVPVVNHGASITIPGSLGTESGPVVYDDFAGTTLGQSANGRPATFGNWTQDFDVSADPTYSNAQSRGVHQRVTRHRYVAGQWNVPLYKEFTSGQARLYLDMWIYMVADVAGQRSRNHKIYRAYPHPSDNAERYDDFFYHTTVCLALGTGGGAFGECGNNYSDLGPLALGSQFVQLPFNQWCHLQAAGFIHATQGAWFYIQDHLTYVNRVNVNTTDGSRLFWRIRAPHYLGVDAEGPCPATTGFTIYASCVYVANTWARVELGNANTYSSCTIREIQRPTSWNGSITYVPNRGALPLGTAWEYVINGSNQVISTRQVTIQS